jgi:hypothetical protein
MDKLRSLYISCQAIDMLSIDRRFIAPAGLAFTLRKVQIESRDNPGETRSGKLLVREDDIMAIVEYPKLVCLPDLVGQLTPTRQRIKIAEFSKSMQKEGNDARFSGKHIKSRMPSEAIGKHCRSGSVHSNDEDRR